MPTNLKLSNNVTLSGGLSAIQKLDLYQIIAFAEDGDTRNIITRARQMLKSNVALTPTQSALLRQMTLPQILDTASRVATNGFASTEPRVLTIDLETLKTIEEAGGWDRHDQIGISVLCAHDSATGHYHVFSDALPDAWRMVYNAEPLAEFARFTAGADLINSFNGSRFDKPVCAANGIGWTAPDYDLLIEGWIGQGLDPNPAKHTDEYKGGLNDYARANLGGIEKNGTGELAPHLWREGRYREVIEYCLLDVRLTVALFRLAQERGWLDNPKTGKQVVFRQV